MKDSLGNLKPPQHCRLGDAQQTGHLVRGQATTLGLGELFPGFQSSGHCQREFVPARWFRTDRKIKRHTGQPRKGSQPLVPVFADHRGEFIHYSLFFGGQSYLCTLQSARFSSHRLLGGQPRSNSMATERHGDRRIRPGKSRAQDLVVGRQRGSARAIVVEVPQRSFTEPTAPPDLPRSIVFPAAFPPQASGTCNGVFPVQARPARGPPVVQWCQPRRQAFQPRPFVTASFVRSRS